MTGHHLTYVIRTPIDHRNCTPLSPNFCHHVRHQASSWKFLALIKVRSPRASWRWENTDSCDITAERQAQLIEKSMPSPSVLAMLLTTKYIDGLPLHRFKKVLGRHHGVDISRQTLARWVKSGEQEQIDLVDG